MQVRNLWSTREQCQEALDPGRLSVFLAPKTLPRGMMAHSSAISCVCKALLKSLEDHCPRELFASQVPTFKIYQSESFTTPPPEPVVEGFSLFPWRIAPNAQMRSQSPRIDVYGEKFRPSLPLDIHMVVTPWAADAERQLALLGWMARHIEDRPLFDANRLNAASTFSDTIFQAHESVELVCDPLAIADLLGLWDKFKPRLPASMTYVARGILLDSEIGMNSGALVRNRTFDFALPKGARN